MDASCKIYTRQTLVLFLIGYFVDGQFLTEPQNIAVVQGDRALFECMPETDIEINWVAYNDSHRSMIANGSQMISSDAEYSIQGQYNLLISEVKLDHAGMYSCVTNSGSKSARLIILDSDPKLSSSITNRTVVDGDQLEFFCEVQYRGEWAPRMYWTDRNQKLVFHTNQNKPGLVKTVVEMIASRYDNGDQYTCTTGFKKIYLSPTNKGEAENVPSFVHTVGSGVLDIQYAPVDVHITWIDGGPLAAGDTLSAGDIITCTADSNPPVDQYKWMYVANNQTISTGKRLTIDEKMLEAGPFKCVVSNSIGYGQNAYFGKDSSQAILDEETSSKTKLSLWAILGLVIGCVSLIGMLYISSTYVGQKLQRRGLYTDVTMKNVHKVESRDLFQHFYHRDSSVHELHRAYQQRDSSVADQSPYNYGHRNSSLQNLDEEHSEDDDSWSHSDSNKSDHESHPDSHNLAHESHLNSDNSAPHPNSDNSAPHRNSDNSAPHRNSDNSAPYPNSNNSVPHPNSNNSAPHPNSDNSAPHPNSDNSAPHRNSDNSAPHRNSDNSTQCNSDNSADKGPCNSDNSDN